MNDFRASYLNAPDIPDNEMSIVNIDCQYYTLIVNIMLFSVRYVRFSYHHGYFLEGLS